MVNCAVAGSVIGMRMRPLLSSRLWPAVLPVATVGQLAPSMESKTGSAPLVLVKSACSEAVLRLMPSLGWWHVAQVRALAPSAVKKGPDSTMLPAVV